jgi:aspartate racemase
MTQDRTPATVGLIGGMSWESTALYYRLLNEGAAARLGGLHSLECIVYSVDFAEIEELQSSGRWELAGDRLAGIAGTLQDAGADVLLLCTNTMHKVADRIEQAVDVPLLHIADVTAAAVGRAGMDRVGLLATAFTMEQSFYRSRLEGHGIEVCVPGDTGRAAIHRIIYEELCRGVIRAESRQLVQRLIDGLVDDGAQGVILGCTEVELLISAADSPVQVFPTTQLHVEAALEHALPRGGQE